MSHRRKRPQPVKERDLETVKRLLKRNGLGDAFIDRTISDIRRESARQRFSPSAIIIDDCYPPTDQRTCQPILDSRRDSYPRHDETKTIAKGLFVIRGVAGSGKSTLAKALVRMFVELSAIHSEDDFWTDKDGNYHYDASTTDQAIGQMIHRAHAALGWAPVVILHTAAQDFSHPAWPRLFHKARSLHIPIFPLILQREATNPPSVHGLTEEEMTRHIITIDTSPVIHLPFLGDPPPQQ